MWKIPLFDIFFNNAEKKAVQEVLHSGWLTMGEVTKRFEQKFADFIGSKHAVAVSSCTAALHLANLSLEIGSGDEVICPSLTFVAGANSILYADAIPIFADITGMDNFCISPKEIELKITAKTKAIQVMHYAGFPCDMDAIKQIADTHHLSIIEDCAHAPGADYKGRKCGTIGDIGCFSFFSNKNMTTGEGGMLTTDNDLIAKKVRMMRSHGMTTVTLDRHKGHAFSYDVLKQGFNYRIDEIRSAIGIAQLEKLPANNRRRHELKQRYIDRLIDSPMLTIPFNGLHEAPDETSVDHIFPILLNTGIDRHRFMTYLKKCGIQSSIHYPPTHKFSYFKNRWGNNHSLPMTEQVAKREVTLPLFPSLENKDIDYITQSILSYEDRMEALS